jgi:hypothetical protein
MWEWVSGSGGGGIFFIYFFIFVLMASDKGFCIDRAQGFLGFIFLGR